MLLVDCWEWGELGEWKGRTREGQEDATQPFRERRSSIAERTS